MKELEKLEREWKKEKEQMRREMTRVAEQAGMEMRRMEEKLKEKKYNEKMTQQGKKKSRQIKKKTVVEKKQKNNDDEESTVDERKVEAGKSDKATNEEVEEEDGLVPEEEDLAEAEVVQDEEERIEEPVETAENEEDTGSHGNDEDDTESTKPKPCREECHLKWQYLVADSEMAYFKREGLVYYGKSCKGCGRTPDRKKSTDSTVQMGVNKPCHVCVNKGKGCPYYVCNECFQIYVAKNMLVVNKDEFPYMKSDEVVAV